MQTEVFSYLKKVTFANTDQKYVRYWNKKCKTGRE